MKDCDDDAPVVEDVTEEVFKEMNAVQARNAEKGDFSYYHAHKDTHKKDPNAPLDQFAGGPISLEQAKLNTDAVGNRGYANMDQMESMEMLLKRYQNHRRKERERMQGAKNAIQVTTYSWADAGEKRVKVYIPLDEKRIPGGVDCSNTRIRFTHRRCILNFDAGGKTYFLRLNLDSGNCNVGKIKDAKITVKVTGTSNPKIILTLAKLVPGEWSRLVREDPYNNAEWQGEPEPPDDDQSEPGDPNEDRQLQYKHGEQLGGRDESKVYQVSHIETGKEFAVKVINCPEMEDAGFAYTEARIMRQLKGDQFVEYQDCFIAPDRSTGAFAVQIVMEYCPEGDFMAHLNNLPGGPREGMEQDAIGRMLTPVLDGMRLMHAKGIIHRDIKPANLFCKNGTAKLADFGIAKETGIANCQTGAHSATRGIGTLKYMPPEIETRSASTEWDVSPASDVWAFGIVLLDAAGVEVTKPLCTRAEVEEAISQIPRKYGPEFRRVVLASLSPHSKNSGCQRPPAMDILQLPFFMNYYDGWFMEYVPKVATLETTMFLAAYD
jgi:hypothetical protein